MSEKKFSYGLDFQLQILSMMVRDPNFLATTGDLVKPSYFTNIYLSSICNLIYDYFKNHAKLPSKTSLDTMLIDKSQSDKFDHEILATYQTYVSQICNMELTELDFINSTVIDFCRQQEYLDTTKLAYNLLKSPDKDGTTLDKISSLWLGAINKGFSDNIGINLKSSASKFKEHLAKEFSGDIRVPTGFPTLTNLLFGGYRRKGLYAYVAPPERGKTTLMASEAASALRCGYTVVFYTFEVSEFDVLMKIVMNLVSMTYDQILDPRYNDMFNERIQIWTKYQPNIYIKYFTRETVSTNALMAHTSKVKLMNGANPDIAFVDYADLLLPSTGTKNMMYLDKGQIYSDLKKYAGLFDIPVITASQPKTEYFNEPLLRMEHMEGSGMKSHILDGCITINQTADERALYPPMIRLYNAKVRSGSPYKSLVNCEMDYSLSRASEITSKNG